MFATCAVPGYRSMSLLHHAHPYAGFRPMTFRMEESDNTSFVPRANAWSDADGYRVVIELPGMKREQITISYKEDVLTVSGEKKSAAEGGAKWLRRESGEGNFERRFRFRKPVDAGKISASFTDGVLEILVPFAEDAKVRQIEIRG